MMTIDRLEELHTLTGQFAKTAVDAGYDSTAVDFAADVRSLIDAEIERQMRLEEMTMTDTCCICGDVFDVGYEMPNGDCVCATHECCYEYCKCEGKRITQESEAKQ